MINLQNKMAVKVIKKIKYATALYHKINDRRNTILHGKVHAFFKKCTSFGLYRPTSILNSSGTSSINEDTTK